MARTILGTIFILLLASALGFAKQQATPQQQKPHKLPPAARYDKVHPATKPALPMTGKTGPQGVDVNDTTTASAGIETPGYQTTLGIDQQPGHKPPAWWQGNNATRKAGAPPNWEQVGQQPDLADTGAAAASRAEIGGPYGTLGVNGAIPPSEKAAESRMKQEAQNAQKGIAPATTKPGAIGSPLSRRETKQLQKSQPPKN